MSQTRSDVLVANYLADLSEVLAPLPPDRRAGILDDVAGHIAEGRRSLAPDDEAGLRNLLERVGEPSVIAAEAIDAERRTPAVTLAASGSRVDPWVPWLLLAGGVVGGLVPLLLGARALLWLGAPAGWLVGVVLLWRSDGWSTGDKVLGTLVVPLGLGLPLGMAALPAQVQTCVGGSGTARRCTTSGFALPPAVGIPLLLVLLVAPVVTAVHLDRVRRRD